ncbi:ABC transporter substrate-binding protein [Roseibium sp. CAU 1637]|uniref:ABC transporter substrate-binding protein n=1 Tax=Roseibium limicola TaxID=2816037 RepID=A0A939JAH3_9HYPH|nr:extracellular solute-binding protein [Roseibium limicola]MBO0346433.1 ABC transporter substrate-binding protein [Roseibium limicola]
MSSSGTPKLGLSRRMVLKLSGVAAMCSGLVPGLAPGPALAGGTGPLHGLSVFGELKHAKDFSGFSYANAGAPKGGALKFRPPSWNYNQNPQTFNTLNTLILKGDAPPRMEMCFDSLMVRAYDEPDAVYGLVAETVEVSEDGNYYTFNLRNEARFHDGSKLTAEDVAFSMLLLKEKAHPFIRQILAELRDAVVLNETRVVLVFTGKQTRQAPLLAVVLPILSKRYYTAYDFQQTTLTAPLSSGPYKVSDHAVGRYIEYARVKDYWAKDLPVMAGHNNFDTIRLDFFREYQVAFEAFKKGAVTFHEEFSSKIWATDYDFPALSDGKVLRKEFPDDRPAGAQGWFFNSRREKFRDPRVRQAISLAFDFEWANKSLFFDMYERTQSFFQNSDMAAKGSPSAPELSLLEPHRADLPEEVFGEVKLQPVTDGSGFDRKLLAKALDLLTEAGFERFGSKLVDASGAPLTIEFLNNSPGFERIVLPYIKNLERLGISASFRLVDPTQYQARLNDFDFDVCSRRFALSATLGDDIKQLWGSEAAAVPGSNNLAGIADPVVDELIAKILAAETREDMTIAARALDRVLRAGHYWVPQWTKSVHTVALWDIFGYPDKQASYDVFPVESTWWSDAEKAKKLGMAG